MGSTHRNTGSYGDDDEPHDVGIDANDTSCSTHQGHHAKAQGNDPQHGHNKTHQEELPERAQHKNTGQGTVTVISGL